MTLRATVVDTFTCPNTVCDVLIKFRLFVSSVDSHMTNRKCYIVQ